MFYRSIFSLAILLLLVGCGGPKDVRFFPETKGFSGIRNGLKVAIHALLPEECISYFGYNVNAESGCSVLLLTIDNDTPDKYTFRPSDFPLKRISGEQVAQGMHYDTYQRMFWLITPALIFYWPAIPFVVIPYGLRCRQYNADITRMLAGKTLDADDTLTIAPYETVQRFIFVPNDGLKPLFTIKLYNETKGNLEQFAMNVLI